MEFAALRGLSDEEVAEKIVSATLASRYRTTPADRPKAEAAVRNLIRIAEISEYDSAPLEWVLSPKKTNPVYYIHAECDAHYIAFYAAADSLGIDDEKALAKAHWDVINECHLVCFLEDRIQICEYPEVYKVDDMGNPHSTQGPDLLYRDGTAKYYWHGVKLTAEILNDPQKITVEQIAKEANQEVRRALIGLYGEGRWLLDSGARPIEQSDEGRLYKIGEEFIVLVTDGVVQKNGMMPSYTLLINRECRPMIKKPGSERIIYGEPQKMNVHNAIASTYGKRGEDYHVTSRT
jgi:hypothetical protein